jgi:hypothetical protein
MNEKNQERPKRALKVERLEEPDQEPEELTTEEAEQKGGKAALININTADEKTALSVP